MAIVAGVALFTLVAGFPIVAILAHAAHVGRTTHKLQHDTDHAQLLRECRHLLSRRDEYAQHDTSPDSAYVHLSANEEDMPP